MTASVLVKIGRQLHRRARDGPRPHHRRQISVRGADSGTTAASIPLGGGRGEQKSTPAAGVRFKVFQNPWA
jgi:hypothetical protein